MKRSIGTRAVAGIVVALVVSFAVGCLQWSGRAPGEEFGTIDGDRLKESVQEICAIAERYRDAGHQYWGRLAGSEADGWMREWTVARFTAAGLADVRDVPMELTEPQWRPQSWQVTASTASQTMTLRSAQPYTESVSTPPEGLDLEAVWTGLGTAADFEGRDVRGKAAVIYATTYTTTYSTEEYDSLSRAAKGGAAAILVIIAIPGNYAVQADLGRDESETVKVPVFALGKEDGEALRMMMEQAPARLRMTLETERVPGLQTSNVWGVLPGTSEEDIVILAHRDGYFQGAGDNASGTAVLVGLAEYFAQVPETQRPRTLRFVATSGHHQQGLPGNRVISQQRDTYLANTVFLVNLEHVAWAATYPRMSDTGEPQLRASTTVDANRWFVNGSDRLEAVVLSAFREFGVPLWTTMESRASGEGSAFSRMLPMAQTIFSPAFMHSDGETPDVIPETGLAAIARAYARIIGEVSKLSRAELQSS